MGQNPDVERIAETHYVIRAMMVNALKNQILTPYGRQVTGGHENYFDMWQSGMGDRFFDMATMVRLGTAVEVGLREHHRTTGAVPYNNGIYQRLVEPTELIELFKHDCMYDLENNPFWASAREVMVHRHLYAHRSGLVDDKYITDLQRITGQDIRPSLVSMNYPIEQVYWFKPLDKLHDYIESMRSFFKALN